MMHVPPMFLSEWREFPSAPCLAKKKNFMTARVSMLLKLRASSNMLPFNLCKKKNFRHMNRPFFPTTLAIPSDDIGKWVGLRAYQHPLVYPFFLIYMLVTMLRRRNTNQHTKTEEQHDNKNSVLSRSPHLRTQTRLDKENTHCQHT